MWQVYGRYQHALPRIQSITFTCLFSGKETHLDLDEFKLEKVCTSREDKHSGEELGIWFHLKINIGYTHHVQT